MPCAATTACRLTMAVTTRSTSEAMVSSSPTTSATIVRKLCPPTAVSVLSVSRSLCHNQIPSLSLYAGGINYGWTQIFVTSRIVVLMTPRRRRAAGSHVQLRHNAQERLQLVDEQRHQHHALLLRQGTVQFGRRQRHLAAASRRRRAAGASLQLLHSLVSSTKLTINQPSALNLYQQRPILYK